MSDTEFCLLTTKAFTILEAMLDRYLRRYDPMVGMLRRKLDKAVVVFREDIPPTVVTLNSRVMFRVNDGPAETRILAPEEERSPVGLSIPLTNRRGLAMLGLAEGQSATIDLADGAAETITVLRVVYQPEAAKREQQQLRSQARTGPFLRVVHRSDQADPRGEQRQRVLTSATDTDDPGPSAA